MRLVVANVEKLLVAQKAYALTLDLYRITRAYPPSEMYGLTSQTRRAAASIGANLAEGSGRESDAELARFTRIALGSASELGYHLLLARDLEFASAAQWEDLDSRTREVRRMLAALARSLQPPR